MFRIKNSRLVAELKEIDSYLTDSDSDSDYDDTETQDRPNSSQTVLDNSVLRMAQSLLAAAKTNPIPRSTVIPTVTMRLTRLDLSPSDAKDCDPRIPATIEKLRAIGVDVQLGECTTPTHLNHTKAHSAAPPRSLRPSNCINLDLSILIALVSDLTHASLPTSVEEAEACFTPGNQYIQWKMKRMHVTKHCTTQRSSSIDDANDSEHYIAKPSRALIQQAQQEMSRPLLQEIFERTQQLAQVEFWTTPEAQERCLQIVGKIGGPKEKARAKLLLTSQCDIEQAKVDFWRHSRYPTGYIPLIPVRLLPSDCPVDDAHLLFRTNSKTRLTPFMRALERTSRDILAQGVVSHQSSSDGFTSEALYDRNLSEMRRAPVAKANPRLTAHTIQSILWGSARGWTTMTANRSSVKILLRELQDAQDGALWGRSSEGDFAHDLSETAGLGQLSLDGDSQTAVNCEIAALWTVDPRSLAEGMRAEGRS